jgi:predicted permease
MPTLTIYAIDPILFVVLYVLTLGALITMRLIVKIVFPVSHEEDNGLIMNHESYAGITVYTQGGKHTR